MSSKHTHILIFIYNCTQPYWPWETTKVIIDYSYCTHIHTYMFTYFVTPPLPPAVFSTCITIQYLLITNPVAFTHIFHSQYRHTSRAQLTWWINKLSPLTDKWYKSSPVTPLHLSTQSLVRIVRQLCRQYSIIKSETIPVHPFSPVRVSQVVPLPLRFCPVLRELSIVMHCPRGC
jgi:hypothetical protein